MTKVLLNIGLPEIYHKLPKCYDGTATLESELNSEYGSAACLQTTMKCAPGCGYIRVTSVLAYELRRNNLFIL